MIFPRQKGRSRANMHDGSGEGVLKPGTSHQQGTLQQEQALTSWLVSWDMW